MAQKSQFTNPASLFYGLKFTAASLRDTGAERCFYRLLLRPGCPRGCWRCTVYGIGEGCFQKRVTFVRISSFGSTASTDDEQFEMREFDMLHFTVQKAPIFKHTGLCKKDQHRAGTQTWLSM